MLFELLRLTRTSLGVNMEGADQEVLTAREQRVRGDQLAKYRGSAKVWITHLDFPHPSRQIDRRVIEQLKRDFDGEGCIKDRADHRIPAIIDDSTLQEGLEKLAISTETFKASSRDNPPHLRLGAKLECLHGQHRALAAKEHLAPSLRWWIVDLYSIGQCISIEFSSTLIYYKILKPIPKKLYEKGIRILQNTLPVKSFVIYDFVTMTTTL